MASLTKCLKQSDLSTAEKDEIRARTRRYREDEGMTPQEAGLEAVDDAIQETLAERASAAEYIESKGGQVPPSPIEGLPDDREAERRIPRREREERPERPAEEPGRPIPEPEPSPEAVEPSRVLQAPEEVEAEPTKISKAVEDALKARRAERKEDVPGAPASYAVSRITPRKPRTASQAFNQVTDWIKPITLKWAEDVAPEVIVAEGVLGLPQRLQRVAKTGDQGVYDPPTGRIYLLADAISSRQEALTVLAHESIGHAAMEQIVPDWGDVVSTVGQLKKAKDKQVTALAQEVKERYGDLPAKVETKEILAVAVERGVNKGPMARILARVREAIQRWLEKIGLKAVWPQGEIDKLITNAAYYLTKPGSEIRDVVHTVAPPLKATVYHGSPHIFDEFSADRIGSGEGAQVYGHGLYFAEEKAVANTYRPTAAGKIYKVEIPDEAMERMLDWDKPLSDQPDAIRMSLRPFTEDMVGIGDVQTIEQLEAEHSGEDVYRDMSVMMGGDKEASDYLLELGISGIRYLDQQSRMPRTGDEATRNVVLFDEKLAKIIRDDEGPLLSRRNYPHHRGVAKRIITGYDDIGQPIEGTTEHTSVQDRAAWKKLIDKHFTKEGRLPREVFERRIEMEGAMSDIGVDEEFNADAFRKAVKKHIGRAYTNLTPVERETINDALAGDDTALQSLVPQIRDTVRAFRGHLDYLSGKTIRTITELMRVRLEALPEKRRERTLEAMNEAAQGAELADIDVTDVDIGLLRKAFLVKKIQENKGKYLNRAYQAFDDPKWTQKVRKDEAVMNAARAFFRAQILDEQARRLEKEAKRRLKEQGVKATEDRMQKEVEALQQQRGLAEGTISDMVEGRIGEVLDAAEGKQDLISFLSSEKLGQKDLGILKRRKDVPEPIRDLLGEYKDPVYNYARSATKMGFLVASHDFLMNVRNQGLGAWLSRESIGDFTTPITARDPETMTPLTGLYATKEFNEALQDAIGPQIVSPMMRALLAINATVKYGKTVLSPITMMRNFISAGFFTIMNGHFNWYYAGKGFGATVADLVKAGDVEKWRAYIKKLIQKGVLHSNVRSEELWEAAKDVVDMDRPHHRIVQGVKVAAIKIPTKLYRAGDDFWKIIGFENEKASAMRWRKMSEDAAETLAAERIRNGYPTYSHVPATIRFLRRFPLMGPFVSFPWEILRTTSHQFRFIQEDWQAGAKLAATRRAAGMAIAGSAAQAISAWTMSQLGIDDEEDEAYRAMGPRWQRNSQLTYFIGPDGQYWTFDFSHMDPYTYAKRWITALLNGNNEGALEKIGDSAMELLEPFLGVEITTGAAMEVAMNYRLDTGRPVWNEQASIPEKIETGLNHLRRRLQPGVASQLENLWKASNEEVSRGGKEYKLPIELATWVGLKFNATNPGFAIKYRAYEFTDALSNAQSLLTYPLTDPNEVTKAEIEDAFSELVKSRQRLYRDMHRAIKGARAVGMEDNKIRQILWAGKVSMQDIDAIMKGKEPTWWPSPQFLRQAQIMSRATARTPEKAAEARQRFAERRREVMRLAREESARAREVAQAP